MPQPPECMARKKRKKKKRQKGSPLSGRHLSLPQLQEKIHLLLERGRYQEALPLAKELTRREDSPENRQLLARVYLGRAHGLAAKGLLQEARALLDTMSSRCGETEEVYRLRLVLLIREGSWRLAVESYQRLAPGLDQEERHRIETLFGAVLLTGQRELCDLLPRDSLLVQQYDHAERALQAFDEKRPDAVRAALKAISFRSPYRDLRLLLSGCLLLSEDPDRADALLQKIAPDSPYAPAALSCRYQDTDPHKVLKAWQQGTDEERETLTTTLHLHAKELDFVKELLAAADNGKRLYQLIAGTSHKGLPRPVRQRLLRRLLPHCKEQAVEILNKDRTMSMAKKYRYTALAAELDTAWEISINYWEDYLETLDRDDPAFALKAALILRHQDKLLVKAGGTWNQVGQRLSLLSESLEHDPNDVETWLQVIELSRTVKGEQRCYQLVNKALQQLPDEPEILLAAMEAAMRRRAFKKAARLADRVLALDPVNIKARNCFLASRIGHGTKLVSQGKLALARREFQAAVTDTRSLRYRGRGQICLGLLCLMEGEEQQAWEWIDQGRAANGSPLFATLLILMQAHLFKMPAAVIKKFTAELRQLVKKNKPLRDDLLRLADWITSFEGVEWMALSRCLKVMKGYLSKGAGQQWDKEEGLRLCRGFLKAGLLVPLAKVADRLHKKWPDHPEIEAYELVGRSRNKGRRLFHEDAVRMIQLAQQFRGFGGGYLADALRKGAEHLSERRGFSGGLQADHLQSMIFDIIERFEGGFDDDDDENDAPFFEQQDLF